MATSLLEDVPNISSEIISQLSRLVNDTIAVLFERDPTRFLRTHYRSVDGTNEFFVTFEFDWEAFNFALDFEFRAALRARGFELPGMDDVGHLIGAPNRAPS